MANKTTHRQLQSKPTPHPTSDSILPASLTVNTPRIGTKKTLICEGDEATCADMILRVGPPPEPVDPQK